MIHLNKTKRNCFKSSLQTDYISFVPYKIVLATFTFNEMVHYCFGEQLPIFCIVCLYCGGCIYIYTYQDGRTGTPLIYLTLPHFCACLKPEHRISLTSVI